MRQALSALLITACVASTGPPAVTEVEYDLTDPALLARLGLGEIEGVEWRREIGGIEVLGIATRPDPAELELIEAAIAEVPEELSSVRPRSILRVPEAELGDRLHPEALAFSKGPDIFFIDRLFVERPTRFDLARAYLHELAHVAQFQSLDHDYLTAVLAGELGAVDPAAGSTLVLDFAATTGWVDLGGGGWMPEWKLTTEPSTEYGALGPHEDMAESVGLVALGRAELLPADRVSWVEGWLGADAERLAAGKPWVPAGSVEVLAEEPLYEEARVEELAVGVGHAEAMYFKLPIEVDNHEDLAVTVEQRLVARGFSGQLERLADERLPHYGGEFAGSVLLWVELWDFREASGLASSPETPILTYVVLW